MNCTFSVLGSQHAYTTYQWPGEMIIHLDPREMVKRDTDIGMRFVGKMIWGILGDVAGSGGDEYRFSAMS